jgi:hypothetical protein
VRIGTALPFPTGLAAPEASGKSEAPVARAPSPPYEMRVSRQNENCCGIRRSRSRRAGAVGTQAHRQESRFTRPVHGARPSGRASHVPIRSRRIGARAAPGGGGTGRCRMTNRQESRFARAAPGGGGTGRCRMTNRQESRFARAAPGGGGTGRCRMNPCPLFRPTLVKGIF